MYQVIRIMRLVELLIVILMNKDIRIVNVDGDVLNKLGVFLTTIKGICDSLSDIGKVTITTTGIVVVIDSTLVEEDIKSIMTDNLIIERLNLPVYLNELEVYIPVVFKKKRLLLFNTTLMKLGDFNIDMKVVISNVCESLDLLGVSRPNLSTYM